MGKTRSYNVTSLQTLDLVSSPVGTLAQVLIILVFLGYLAGRRLQGHLVSNFIFAKFAKNCILISFSIDTRGNHLCTTAHAYSLSQVFLA